MRNLIHLALDELERLQNEVSAEIAARRQQGCLALLDELKILASEKGFSLRELLGEPEKPATPKAKPKGIPRYHNPQNGNQTWTGHGRKPQWVVDFLAGGGQLADLKI
ncbi:DNA-binding protein H-NS [Andreprevotia lacus DSM 23236]|uniref:DNA-binding protein H-NS n=1 Tax=Andreprevotia lacus DSM 23236 TaxID=1121001 RepID=A0A1W1XZT6_9NEIS|nr:H-NS histone family protein [Andreprevotia lacus]SMC29051.1 DNA-binding protein H-NS [Andreprevotia lacus DSM 23236]